MLLFSQLWINPLINLLIANNCVSITEKVLQRRGHINGEYQTLEQEDTHCCTIVAIVGFMIDTIKYQLQEHEKTAHCLH